MEDLKVLAKTELGETEEVKRESLAEIKKLLDENSQLQIPRDDDVLLMFLRARKFKVPETIRTIKRYLRARRDIPEYFDNLTPSSIPYQAVFNEYKLIMYAKERDSQGRAVAYVNFGAWTPSICSMDDLARCVLVALESGLQDEEIQIRGGVALIDLKGFCARHLVQLTPKFARKVIILAQDTVPVRIKGIYFINCPPVTETLYGLVKSFLSEKLQKRLRFIGSDLSELCGDIPAELMPPEYGGKPENFDLQRQENLFLGKADHFERMLRCSYEEK
ncbi:alpha-tocopherol transfer protein-like [Dermacentor albipictus]|uniref:alpha-tocopherol transfer protein-like n=1 Tax=Dermacentor albipictus TaxID=60249 RepID=UPI0038FD31BE